MQLGKANFMPARRRWNGGFERSPASQVRLCSSNANNGPLAQKELKSSKGMKPARFSLETYLSGEGITFHGWRDSIPRVDKTADLSIASSFADYVEDPKAALLYGFNHIFVKRTAKQPSPSADPSLGSSTDSLLALSFKESPSEKTIDEYAIDQRTKFFESNPRGLANMVQLDPSVTEHLKVPHAIRLYEVRIPVVINMTQLAYGGFANMAMYLKTPGGFWSILLFTASNQMHLYTDQFAEVVKSITLNLKENKLEPPSASNTKASNAKANDNNSEESKANKNEK